MKGGVALTASRLLPPILTLTLALVLGGCGPLDAPIHFDAMVGAQEFAWRQTSTGLGTTATSYTPKDLRLYVSNVRLITETGDEVPYTLEEDGDRKSTRLNSSHTDISRMASSLLKKSR